MNNQDTVVAFDIETVPDTDLLRRFHGQVEASDDEIVALARDKALARSNERSDFLPLAFHKVAAISVVMRTGKQLCVDSKVQPQHSEAEAVRSMFKLIDTHPTLVSWNGSGFDLPVLHLRAMHHSIIATGFWQGPGDKWNQYSSRYHGAHQDLMDILAQHNPRGNSKLESVALSCGLPGKMGHGGDQVYDMYRAERFKEISNYCEIDALNTYLLWLRFQMVCGNFNVERYAAECALVENFLASSAVPHLMSFLEVWLKHRIVGSD